MTVHDRWGPRAFTVRNPEMQAFAATVRGRDRWALEALIAAGPRGCTPIDNPAQRWAAYGRPSAGSHARHALRSKVEPARVFAAAENSGAHVG